MHLYRPKFLTWSQGPPSYYSAYDFQHLCKFYPDESLLKNIILLEDEPIEAFEKCDGSQFVTSGHFHRLEDIEMLRKLIGQVNYDQI